MENGRRMRSSLRSSHSKAGNREERDSTRRNGNDATTRSARRMSSISSSRTQGPSWSPVLSYQQDAFPVTEVKTHRSYRQSYPATYKSSNDSHSRPVLQKTKDRPHSRGYHSSRNLSNSLERNSGRVRPQQHSRSSSTSYSYHNSSRRNEGNHSHRRSGSFSRRKRLGSEKDDTGSSLSLFQDISEDGDRSRG